ncbi:MAG: hypothetical protein H7263_04725, partial [Candidatus Sericytochromatia bacterium]|nr:hypothetical protein [Candidatus Sericytochromatia bacterium]
MKKVFKIFLKYILPVIVVIFTGVLYILYNPPASLVEYIRKQAEIQVSKVTELHTRIDKISMLRVGIFSQTAIADGITILKSKEATAPVFINSNKLDVRFNLLNYFLFGAKNSTLKVHIIKPIVDMQRDKSGTFDINSSLFRPSKKKESTQSDIPVVSLDLDNGYFIYKDKTFANPLSVNARIPIVKVDIKDSVYVAYSTKLYEHKDLVDLKGTLNTKTGQGTIDSKINIEDFSRWVNVFYNSTKGKFVIRKGNLNLDLKGKWNDYKLADLQFKTNVEAKELIGKFPYYNAPLNLEKLSFSLDQNKVDLRNIEINTQGTHLTVSADSAYNGDKTYIKSSIRTNNFYMSRIINAIDKKLIPDSVRKLNLSGTGKFNIDLEGFFPKINTKLAFFSYPETFQLKDVRGKIEIDDGTIMSSKFNRLSTKVNLDGHDARLSELYLKAYQGNVIGDLTVKKIFKGKIGAVDNKNAYFMGNIKANNISINNIVDDYKVSIPKQYKPYTNLSANVDVAGSLNNPQVKGKIYTSLIKFDPRYSKLKPIDNLYLNLDYSKDVILANTKLRSDDFGRTAIDFSIKNLDKIAIKTVTNNFHLATLNNFIPGEKISIYSGILDGDINTYFSLNEIKKHKKLDLKTISHIIAVKSKLDFNHANINYKALKSPVSLTNTEGNIYLNMGNGDIASKVYVHSNEVNNFNAIVNLNNADKLDAKVSTVNLPLKKIEPFVPNFVVKSGLLTLNSNVKTKLTAFANKLTLEQMIAVLITNTSIKLNNASFKYQTGKSKPFALTNANGTFSLKNNGQDVNSSLALVSKEFGNTNANLLINNLNQTNAKLSVENISTSYLASYIPNLKSKKGTA